MTWRKAPMRLVTTWTRVVPAVPIVASVIVGVFFTGAARYAHASLAFGVGEIYCHATAAGPRYFHSGVSHVSVAADDYLRWRLLEERRVEGRILDRVLDDLAVEFARVVAARGGRDDDHLLSPRCELTAAGEAAADAIGAAAYFRGGERVFYPAGRKIAVDWTPPDFSGLWAVAASSSYVTWPRVVALVVGNSAYRTDRLPNTVNDAEAVGAALGRLGFDVRLLLDAGKAAMDDALAAFETASDGAEVALVFYAGHGLEQDGSKYLVPIDAPIDAPSELGPDEASLPLQVVSLDDIVAATARASARIVILDAMFVDLRSIREPRYEPQSRDPAFEPPMTSSSGANLLVAYAGSPGGRVYGRVHDGEGENSPYTAALLRYLDGPRSTVLATFGAVAAEVFDRTGGEQAPAVYSTLTTPVTLQRPEPALR